MIFKSVFMLYKGLYTSKDSKSPDGRSRAPKSGDFGLHL
jgi:hypothetical protein